MVATLWSCTVTLWDFNSQACTSSLTPPPPPVWYCDRHWTLLPSLPSDTYLGLVQKGHGEAEDCCAPVSWSPQHANEAQAMVAECGLLALQQSSSRLPCQPTQIIHIDSGSHHHVFPANKHRSYIERCLPSTITTRSYRSVQTMASVSEGKESIKFEVQH